MDLAERRGALGTLFGGAGRREPAPQGHRYMSLRSWIDKLGAGSQLLRGRKGKAPEPAVLREPERFPYGPFRWKTQLPAGTDYMILASPNLRAWVPVSQARASEAPIEYVDSDAPKFTCRFYRLLAGEVPSANVIGYASVSLPPGFSMISNPFDAPPSVSDTFKKWPDGTSVNRFDTRQFRLVENSIKAGKWTEPNERLLRGEGAIFFNPTADYKMISFVGEVCLGSLSAPIPAGFSLRGPLGPQGGNLVDDLGFPIADGDVVHLFDREHQKYMLHPYRDGKWPAGPPIVGIGEAFWIAKTEPRNWVQTVAITG